MARAPSLCRVSCFAAPAGRSGDERSRPQPGERNRSFTAFVPSLAGVICGRSRIREQLRSRACGLEAVRAPADVLGERRRPWRPGCSESSSASRREGAASSRALPQPGVSAIFCLSGRRSILLSDDDTFADSSRAGPCARPWCASSHHDWHACGHVRPHLILLGCPQSLSSGHYRDARAPGRRGDGSSPILRTCPLGPQEWAEWPRIYRVTSGTIESGSGQGAATEGT